MCGIVYVKRAKGVPAHKSILRRYFHQKSRGKEGFGYVAVSNGIIQNIVRARTEDEIKHYLMQEDSEEILFHHRYPTSTPNYVGTAHPIVIQNNAFEFDYIMVHNGVISNHMTLKREHTELGFEYTTEYSVVETTQQSVIFGDVIEKLPAEKKTSLGKYNDSECIAWEFALVAEGWKNSLDIFGGSAFIVYQVRKDGQKNCVGASIESMFYGSNQGRPLVLEAQNMKKKKNKKEKNKGGNENGSLVAIKSIGDGKELETDRLYRSMVIDGQPEVTVSDLKIGKYFETRVSRDHTRSYDYEESKNAYDIERERWGNESVRRKMGFGKDDERDDQVPLLPKSKDEEDSEIEDMFPDDQRLSEIEDELNHALEEKEAEGWVKYCEKLQEEISRLEEEIINSTEMANASNPPRQDFLDEVAEFKTELKLKEVEMLEVCDKLLELNMPVPSNFMETIKY